LKIGEIPLRLKVHQVNKDDIFRDVVRLHRSHRQGINAGQICRVSTNGLTVLAVARGSPSNDVNGIWLDDAMRSRLGLKEGATTDFKIAKASWYEEFTWLWRSSDPVNRTAGRLGIISLVLGLIALLLGLIALFK
jgi:hypothetical protein